MNCPLCGHESSEYNHDCLRCITKKTNRHFWLVAGIVGLPPLFFVAWILSAILIKGAADNKRFMCQENLIYLTLAALDYSEANGGRLPDLSNPEKIRAALGETPTYTCSGHSYHGNAMLSNKKVRDIQKPENVVLFYEVEAVHLNGRNVTYVDGHVKWITAQRWKERGLQQ